MGRKPGQTRLELAKDKYLHRYSIARSIMEYADNPLLLVVSNRVDILTVALFRKKPVFRHHVYRGTRNLPIQPRLRYLIARECGVSISDVCIRIWRTRGQPGYPYGAVSVTAVFP